MLRMDDKENKEYPKILASNAIGKILDRKKKYHSI